MNNQNITGTMTTILVNQELCTRCGICANVCAAAFGMGIIDHPDENTLPAVSPAKAGLCIRCGHCEAHCPTQALLLNDRPDEKVRLPSTAIAPEDLGWYLRKRRSVRHYSKEPVPKEIILELLDIARYAASGCNGQPVEWIVIHDKEKVHRVAELTIDWMRTLLNTGHPMSAFVPGLIAAWDGGNDVICRNAPHLLVAIIPEGNPIAAFDGIIALTHFDLAAPAHGVGTCWAGFVAGAAREFPPLLMELGIPEGRTISYAMMFGHPRYKIHGLPRRKPLQVTWK
jgi:nitroreductase/NAD-dependent dihydropyrimidine dehydrogenase PreA subunit